MSRTNSRPQPLPRWYLALALFCGSCSCRFSGLSRGKWSRSQVPWRHGQHAKCVGVSRALSEGEVRKIDLAGQKITLRHGPLKSVGMPPMTMVFGVRNAGLQEGISVGDKVRFQVEQQGSQVVVTELQAAE